MSVVCDGESGVCDGVSSVFGDERMREEKVYASKFTASHYLKPQSNSQILHATFSCFNFDCYFVFGSPTMATGDVGRPVRTKELCHPFGIAVDFSRTGLDPVQMKTNVTVYDVVSILSKKNADVAIAMIQECQTEIQIISDLLANFFDTVNGSTPEFNCSAAFAASQYSSQSPPPSLSPPPLGSMASPRRKAELNVSQRKLAGTLDIARLLIYDGRAELNTSTLTSRSIPPDTPQSKGDPASISKKSSPISNSGSPGAKSDRSEATFSPPLVSQNLTDLAAGLANTMVEGYGALKQIENEMMCASSNVSLALDNALQACIEVDELVERVRVMAVIAAGQTPSYCGWVRRSSAFSKAVDKSTTGSIRSWGVLIQNVLYFMAQPYSCAVSSSVKKNVKNISELIYVFFPSFCPLPLNLLLFCFGFFRSILRFSWKETSLRIQIMRTVIQEKQPCLPKYG